MATLTGPVTQTERIDSLDVLRGFALLGILVMNIMSFSMPFSAYFNPTSFGDLTGANYWVWFFSHLLFDQKFMTIFSMLFGAGIIIFTARAAERGRSPAAMHYRRTFWLLVIGAIHAYLLWYGDILVLYAMCALIIYPARKLSPKALLAIGLTLLVIGSGISLMAGFSMPHWPPDAIAEMTRDWKPSPEQLNEEITAYTGPWTGQLSHRAPLALEFQTFVFFVWGFWRAAGLMLMGMALYKWGVFNATCSRKFYRKLAAAALVGLPLVFTGVRMNEASQWDMYFSFFKGVQFNYWGSVLVSTAYIGLLMLFCQSAGGGWLKGSLRAVGQMAFTNYLMHTLICIMVFYGPGLGLFGQVDRLGQIGAVFVIWIAQLIYSPIWLRHFRFGPFEWLWRSLTYWQLQPMRRAEPTVATAAAS